MTFASRAGAIELDGLFLADKGDAAEQGGKGTTQSHSQVQDAQAETKALTVPLGQPDLTDIMLVIRHRSELGNNPGAALLGTVEVQDQQGAYKWSPVMVWLPDTNIRHMFIASSNGDALMMLKNALFSMALQFKPRDMGLVLIGDERDFGPVAFLPHVRGKVTKTSEDTRVVLRKLAQEISERLPRGVHRPQFIVAASELAELGQFEDVLTVIAEDGPDVGIRLVVATHRPGDQWVAQFVKHFPFRLVGQVDLEKVATAAAGRTGTRAEGQRQGEFTAAYNDKTVQFSAVYSCTGRMYRAVEWITHRGGRMPNSKNGNGDTSGRRLTGHTALELYGKLAKRAMRQAWHQVRGEQ
jgi:hypothetical protein